MAKASINRRVSVFFRRLKHLFFMSIIQCAPLEVSGFLLPCIFVILWKYAYYRKPVTRKDYISYVFEKALLYLPSKAETSMDVVP